MAYTVEDEKHFMLECPAYQEIRSEFGELFDYCEGDLRKLMCHPKQHMLAKLVHKMRVFRDEDTEWVIDLHSLTDLNRVKMKVVVMFLVMSMRTN